jgi:hypothetical protein
MCGRDILRKRILKIYACMKVRRKMREYQREAPNPLFCVYLESYRDNSKPRRIIAACMHVKRIYASASSEEP